VCDATSLEHAGVGLEGSKRKQDGNLAPMSGFPSDASF